jgi:hypothetical protein
MCFLFIYVSAPEGGNAIKFATLGVLLVKCTVYRTIHSGRGEGGCGAIGK